MKFCNDCRHCDLAHNSEFSKCRAPMNMSISPVDGQLAPIYTYCKTVRQQSDGCGMDGKWWEPRHDVEERHVYDDEARQAAYERQEDARCEAETGRPR